MNSPLRLKDICTHNVIYYLPQFPGCYDFCEERDIDILPCLDDPTMLWKRDGTSRKFELQPVELERKVDSATPIFSPGLKARFQKHPVLLVFDVDLLIGVVHFSDYNQPRVSAHLYELLYEYENSLRDLIRRERGFGRTQLQESYLKDLHAEAERMGITSLDNDVNKLRNQVMHVKDAVRRKADHEDNLTFDLKHFIGFFKRVEALHRGLRYVQSRLAFSRPG